MSALTFPCGCQVEVSDLDLLLVLAASDPRVRPDKQEAPTPARDEASTDRSPVQEAHGGRSGKCA
jgi:hypothetical protein